jgi:hypothetical protein
MEGRPPCRPRRMVVVQNRLPPHRSRGARPPRASRLAPPRAGWKKMRPKAGECFRQVGREGAPDSARGRARSPGPSATLLQRPHAEDHAVHHLSGAFPPAGLVHQVFVPVREHSFAFQRCARRVADSQRGPASALAQFRLYEPEAALASTPSMAGESPCPTKVPLPSNHRQKQAANRPMTTLLFPLG